MSSNKQIEANRLNSKKSTGPRTLLGKRRSSRNAVKHGILVAAPIMAGIEREDEWIAHRLGIFESLSPVGYLEELLAERAAILSWRLRRVARYEASVAAARIDSAEADVAARHANEIYRPDGAEEHARVDAGNRAIRTLKNVLSMPEESELAQRDATAAQWAIFLAMPEGSEGVSVEGIPNDDDEYHEFDHWTVRLLKRSVVAHARAARMNVGAFLSKALREEDERRSGSAERERAAKSHKRSLRQEVTLSQRERILLEPTVLTGVARYEAGLERAFHKNLREIERLQASRKSSLASRLGQ